MKKFWKKAILILGLCMLFSPTAYGQKQTSGQITQERQLPRLVDEAGILSQEESTRLLSQLDEISERQQFDVVIAVINSLSGQKIENLADDFYDYNGYGMGSNHDGILFLISMEEREWAISTSGFGIRAFTDAGQAYMVKQFRSDLSDGKYGNAFSIFAKWSDDFITQAREGKPYDKGHLPVTASNIIFCIAVGLLAGFALALVRMWMMKWQMRTVYHQPAASDYLVNGSCRMQDNREWLVRRTVSRIHIAKEEHTGGGGGSTTHTSSSGNTHGGSHGTF